MEQVWCYLQLVLPAWLHSQTVVQKKHVFPLHTFCKSALIQPLLQKNVSIHLNALKRKHSLYFLQYFSFASAYLQVYEKFKLKQKNPPHVVVLELIFFQYFQVGREQRIPRWFQYSVTVCHIRMKQSDPVSTRTWQRARQSGLAGGGSAVSLCFQCHSNWGYFGEITPLLCSVRQNWG